jgi:hypothetical protein
MADPNKIHESNKATVKGHNVSLQADGWTGLNYWHLIAFIIVKDEQVST